MAAWVGALVLGSVVDGVTKAALGTQGEWHRVWHLGAFGATVVVVGWSLAGVVRGWLAGLMAFGVGAVCELLQRLIYIPVVEWKDLGDDGIGAAMGWVVLTVWRRWEKGRAAGA